MNIIIPFYPLLVGGVVGRRGGGGGK